MHKLFVLFLSAMAATAAGAQQYELIKIWETDTVIAVPESVLPGKGAQLYISLIDGPGWAADGKGGVGILSPDGKNFNGTWITGLHAPKGMGLAGKELYVADITEVVVVDTKKGKIKKRIAIDSAQGLNDITTANRKTFFVSDSRQAKIWKIRKGKPSLYVSGVRGVNGIKWTDDKLYIGAGKDFMVKEGDAAPRLLVTLPQGIDGIEPAGNGSFILTSWSGYVYYVSATGQFQTLLETHAVKKNTADIYFDRETNTVYVPTFNGKTVAAYRLQQKTGGN